MSIERRIDSAAETLPIRAPLGRGTAGQLRVRAYIARTGVLEYANIDGSRRREYRPESEVFSAASLATLEGAPLVLHIDHHQFVRTTDWKRKAVGHVTDVRRDGDFILGTLVVNDEATIAAIDSGELEELSAGYVCAVDQTAGKSASGESYDLIQRGIRYNHVALLRRGAARAGRDVRILRDRLDARDRFDAEMFHSSLLRAAYETRMHRAHLPRAQRSVPPARHRGSIGEVDEEERTVRIVASTKDTVDGERLLSWDLTRFTKNPIVLWGHDAAALPIGTADEIQDTDAGLTMRVRFATARANPLAEQIFQGVREGIVRAVSVGFARGLASELDDGTVERHGNELLEVSFVTVPADENAGTAAVNPAADHERKRAMRKFDIRGRSSAERAEITRSASRGILEVMDSIAARHRDEGRKAPRTGSITAAHHQAMGWSRSERADADEDIVTAAIKKRDEWAANAHRTPEQNAVQTLRDLRTTRADADEDIVTAARRARDERARTASQTGRF